MAGLALVAATWLRVAVYVMCAPQLAILIERIGPYHQARLEALAARLGPGRLLVIEIAGGSTRYPWVAQARAGGFAVHTLFPRAEYTGLGRLRIGRAVGSLLEELSPECVAINGWGFAEALAASAWARVRGRAIVLMSDSQERDAPRTRWKEGLKSVLVRACHSALVAGTRHAAYVERLHMRRERIVQGYDVVDNAHFAKGAVAARRDAEKLRASLGLPERYWLGCSRFIPKKGLTELLRAYAQYRQRCAGTAWGFVLLGDGPLRAELVSLAQELGIADALKMPGFVQYGELPAYYGLASAFVLASTSDQWGLVVNEAMASGLPVLVSRACGCEPDLVIEGVTGYSFEPGDVDGLTELLERTSRKRDLELIGQSAQRHIAGWTPHTFAESMQRAMQIALDAAAGA